VAAYLVNHRYRAGLHAFDEGATVELDDAVAEHVNRDSPGTLTPLGAEPAPELDVEPDVEPTAEPETTPDGAPEPEPEPEPETTPDGAPEPEPEPEPAQRRGGRRGS